MMLLVVAVAVLAVLMMRRSFQSAESTMAETVALRMKLLDQQQSRVDESLELQRHEMELQSKREQAFLMETASLSSKAMEQANLISMNGQQASQTQMGKMLASTISLLSTKDPLAYQQVMGPTQPQDSSATPYTAVDEVAQEEARKAYFEEQETLDRAKTILEGLGVKTDGSASFAGSAQEA